MGITTGFTGLGTDIGTNISDTLVPKSYLIDRYPELADTFKQAGLWIWGNNSSRQLGTNNATPYSSPVQTISAGTNWKQVSCGYSTTAAIKTDGTLWLWGNNSNGTLGDNTTTGKSSPVQTISAGTNWKQVSSGFVLTAAIKTDGTLWVWGYNNYGQLGVNDITHRSSPVQTIAGGTNWKQVSCTSDSNHLAAIKTDGTLWTWGRNNAGQLGDNTNVDKSSPVQTVSGGTNWKQVSVGGEHTAAVKTDGTLWLWGSNSFTGQLGDNTTTPKSSPIQTISAGTNWKQVSCFGDNTTAIKTDGTLWTWGENSHGQLGDNSTTHRSSPVQTVSAGTNWKLVSGGMYHTTAIKTDGTLWTWGDNGLGQLGDNTTVSTSSPTQTVAGGTNWRYIGNGGRFHTACIRDDSADPI